MTRLTELVIKYKETKDNKILEDILDIIKKDIIKRVEIIYRKFKYFKLEKEDIKQELYIKIFNIIEQYNSKEPFENYFFSCLKYWKPKLTKDDTIKFESLYKVDENTGEELEIDIKDKHQNHLDFHIICEEIFHQCKTETEKKICKMYLDNPNITEEDIGQELGMTKQNISLILNKLRKRLKKYLTK